jgi:hypothetical protein
MDGLFGIEEASEILDAPDRNRGALPAPNSQEQRNSLLDGSQIADIVS